MGRQAFEQWIADNIRKDILLTMMSVDKKLSERGKDGDGK